MVYLSSSLIALLLFFVEVSLLPHFASWISLPILILPFLSIISLKDRTIFPVFLAVFLGIAMGSVTGEARFTYLVAYLGVVLISKIFLDRFISYGEFRANLVTIIFGIFVIYGSNLVFGTVSLAGWSWLVPVTASVLTTILVLVIYIVLGQKYFSWLEKETEERFR